MTKHYYTDHLEAQWMHEKYGMEFRLVTNRDLLGVPTSDGPEITGFGLAEIIIEGEENPDYVIKYEMLPESLHLLEPQEGDLVRGRHYDDTTQPHMQGYVTSYYNHSEYDAKNDVQQIILRGGKAFMWPEVEE